MRLSLLVAILFSGAAATDAAAQSQGILYAERGHIAVGTGTNGVRRAAWAGGFNVPQLTMGDLNRDGRQDLVVYERYGEVRTFLAVAGTTPVQYAYAPEYARAFRKDSIRDYVQLVDYNCDNVPDLFTRSWAGVGIFKGAYVNDTLRFGFYRDLWFVEPGNGGLTNAYVESGDIPSIVDVDADGDLDVLAFSIYGARINWYRNRRVEDGLPCDSFRVSGGSYCWGKTFQPFYRTHQLGVGCIPNTPTGDPGMAQPTGGSGPALDAVAVAAAKSAAQHTGNTICLLDMDGDGDMDYLNGNLSFSDLQYLKNGKVEYGWVRDTIVAQDTTWQAGGIQVSMPFWPAAFHLDVDADGKREIIITPHAENISRNVANMWVYRNTGTTSAPQYSFERTDFLQDGSLDAGSNSYPVFYDYNKDGKQDLFIGSTGAYINGTFRGAITYLQNTSTSGSASMQFQTADFMGLSALNFPGAAPAFGDLNGDGKDDMVIGHRDGTLRFYKNTAAASWSQPVWSQPTGLLRTSAGDSLDVGDDAVPVMYDADGDGKLDLVVGARVGSLTFYKNNGAAGSLSLQLVSSNLGGVKVDPKYTFAGYAAPSVGVVDSTGAKVLLVGSGSGQIWRYGGIANGATPYTLLDTMYSGIKMTGRSAPAVADVDGDGWYDMVVGSALGGVKLYRQIRQPGAVAGVEPVAASNMRLYPNPASSTLVVDLGKPLSGNGLVTVFSTTGQRVLVQSAVIGATRIELNIQLLTPGVYMVVLDGPGERAVQRFSVVR